MSKKSAPTNPAAPPMMLGFNYAWSHNRFGAQIGPNPWVDDKTWTLYNRYERQGRLNEIPLPPMFDHINRNFDILEGMGIKVIRWFLLGDGLNYGPPRPFDSPKQDPTNPNVFHFDPPQKLDKRFARDFRKLLEIFAIRKKMKIIPCLISQEFGKPGVEKVTRTDTDKSWTNKLYSNGRVEIFTDPNKRNIFFNTMLTELLNVSKPFKNWIYAWEVINEPSLLCESNSALVPYMRDFLEIAIRIINDAGFKSTIGHRFYDDSGKYNFRSGDVKQFHYYAQGRNFRNVANYDPSDSKGDATIHKTPSLFDGQDPPILGEFDSSFNRSGEGWTTDLGSNDSTLQRLKLLSKEGCKLALLWPDFGEFSQAKTNKGLPDPPTLKTEKEACEQCDFVKLIRQTRQAILSFTQPKKPPITDYDPRELSCAKTKVVKNPGPLP